MTLKQEICFVSSDVLNRLLKHDTEIVGYGVLTVHGPPSNMLAATRDAGLTRCNDSSSSTRAY